MLGKNWIIKPCLRKTNYTKSKIQKILEWLTILKAFINAPNIDIENWQMIRWRVIKHSPGKQTACVNFEHCYQKIKSGSHELSI